MNVWLGYTNTTLVILSAKKQYEGC